MPPFGLLGHRGLLLQAGSSGPLGLDSYAAGVKGVYALKRKWTGYTGACVRVRRASDSAQLDIGFTTTAIDAPIDSAALNTFCAGTNGFVTRIYDQSGTNHLLQNTAAKQPLPI